jgi:hypothetical protein
VVSGEEKTNNLEIAGVGERLLQLPTPISSDRFHCLRDHSFDASRCDAKIYQLNFLDRFPGVNLLERLSDD